MFEREFFVHFDEADPSGISFFATLPVWSHRTVEAFITQSEIGWKDWFDSPEWAVPIKHVETIFHRPLAAGKYCLSRLKLADLGTSSVRFQCEFFDENNKLAATVYTRHVFVNKSDFRKRDIPVAIRSVLGA